MSEKIVTRDFNPDLDNPFIYSSWRNSLWFDTEQYMNPHEFYRKTNKEIKEIIQHSKIRVAYAPNEPEFIYGYSVIQDHTLVWVYVKIDYRRNGLAKLLAQNAKKIGEPKTKVGKDVKRSLERYIKQRAIGICEVPESLPTGEQNGASL